MITPGIGREDIFQVLSGDHMQHGASDEQRIRR
jgi:hypothetical protein